MPKTLKEAFAHQIEVTRLLTEEDLDDDTGDLVTWNGVSFFPDGNFYSSGKVMHVGDKLLCCYITANTSTPVPLILEESEIDFYSDIFRVVRVVDHVPILSRIDDSEDQYVEL